MENHDIKVIMKVLVERLDVAHGAWYEESHFISLSLQEGNDLIPLIRRECCEEADDEIELIEAKVHAILIYQERDNKYVKVRVTA